MNAPVASCGLCKDFCHRSRREHPLWIADLRVSTAVAANNQICRGYTILVYNKRHACELFELSLQDRAAYVEDLTRLARALYEAYHPRKINYALLGNAEPHLHWHVVPRSGTGPVDIRWPIWQQGCEEVVLTAGGYRGVVEEIRASLAGT